MALLLETGSATTCYDGLKLPRLIGPQEDDKDTIVQAVAGSELLNALFIGGMAESDKFKPVSLGKSASIFRLDLAQNSWVWRKMFQCAGCDSQVVTALAVSAEGTKLSAYSTKYDT